MILTYKLVELIEMHSEPLAASLLEKGGRSWPEAFRRSIGVAIKDEEDLVLVRPELAALLRVERHITAGR